MFLKKSIKIYWNDTAFEQSENAYHEGVSFIDMKIFALRQHMSDPLSLKLNEN